MPHARIASTHRRPRTRAAEEGRAASRIPAIGLAVAGIFGLQVAMAWGKMDLPFLDGRLHYNHDNALFSTCARTGIAVGGARSQFGITTAAYRSWGNPDGKPSNYTHHPFLLKAVFQLWVRRFGDSEFSSRAFALGVSMLAAAGAMVALTIASGSALAAFLGTALMVSTPLFAVMQVCIRYEIEAIAVGTWLMAGLFLFLRRPDRPRLTAVGILSVLAPPVHWTAAVLAVALAAWLGAERLRGDRNAGSALVTVAGGAGVGGILTLATLAWLKGGWSPFWSDLMGAFTLRRNASALPVGVWLERQATFIDTNFTLLLVGIVGIAAAAVAARWAIRRARGAGARKAASRSAARRAPVSEARSRAAPERSMGADRALPAFFFCTLATASFWQFGFLQGSFVHHYWQLWFLLPLAALVAATVRAPRRGRFGLAVATAWLVVAVGLQAISRDVYRQTIDLQGGTREDIEFLRSLRDEPFRRFVFVETAPEQLGVWFQGPILPYYTARPLVTYDGSMSLEPGDKVLLLRQPGLAEARVAITERLGGSLENERCGPGLCAYDVRRR